MKRLKKILVLLMAMSMLVMNFSIPVMAADSTLQFTDPDTTQGQVVSVEAVIRADSAIASSSVTLTYDSAALEFVSGDACSGGNGSISYSGTGDGSGTELRFNMRFNVLTAGQTVIEASSGNVTLASGEAQALSLGTSTVNAQEGDGTTAYETPAGGETAPTSATKDGKIIINDIEYTISGDFTQGLIPEGYEESTLSYGGADYKAVSNPNTAVVLGYLVSVDGSAADFFLYDKEQQEFYPYTQVAISDSTSIVLLSNTKGVSLPEQYQSMEVTINDKTFPAWQDMNNDGFYVLYAYDNAGNKVLYQYDNTDGTYQKFIKPVDTSEEKKTSGVLGKIQGLIDNYFMLSMLAIIVAFVLFLVLIITLAIKVGSRNREIDELYEEFGIPEEVEEPKKKNKKTKGNNYSDEDEYDEDDYYDDEDEYYDDEYDDDDYDDEYYDEDDEYYEDDDEYYEDEEYDEPITKKSSKKKDEYGINFIDV